MMIDAIFCINLPRRTDRMEEFSEMARGLSLCYEVFPAVDARDMKINTVLMEENERRRAELACTISHRRVLRYAMEHGMHTIMVMEDDCILDRGWETAVYTFLNYGIEAWDMLYLGINDINKTNEVICEQFSRIRTGFTTHAYIANIAESYDILIDALDFRGPPDVLFAEFVHPKGNSYVITPYKAHQRAGISDITMKEENYVLK